MDNRKNLFGRRIKELRKTKNLTQEKLSEKMDISTTYLSGTERGTENPTFDMLMKYSDALDIEMSELLDFQHQSGLRELIKASFFFLIHPFISFSLSIASCI